MSEEEVRPAPTGQAAPPAEPAEAAGTLRALLKTGPRFNADHRAALEALGVQVHSHTEHIVSVEMPPEARAAVLALPFVVKVEDAHTLAPDDPFAVERD